MHIPHDVSLEDKYKFISENLSKINYPVVVLDVGTNKPKNPARKLNVNDVDISEVAFAVIDKVSDCLQGASWQHSVSIDDDYEAVIYLLCKHLKERKLTPLSHNATTDLRILDIEYERLFGVRLGLHELPYFCTLENGTYFSNVHIYVGGKKVKKYPYLQLLYKYLFKTEIGKGDIIDDVTTCFECFKWIESWCFDKGFKYNLNNNDNSINSCRVN